MIRTEYVVQEKGQPGTLGVATDCASEYEAIWTALMEAGSYETDEQIDEKIADGTYYAQPVYNLSIYYDRDTGIEKELQNYENAINTADSICERTRHFAIVRYDGIAMVNGIPVTENEEAKKIYEEIIASVE